MIASVAWQLRGFREGQVPEDATRRVLRASLRRISPVPLGRSLRVTEDTTTHIDHCVPISVIADILLAATEISAPSITHLLDRYLCSATLTEEEHRVGLGAYHSTMPPGWDPDSPAPDNNLARYSKVGILLAEDGNGRGTGGGGDDFGTEGDDDSGRQRFPMRAFRAWADRNDFSDDVNEIDELASNLPQHFRDRASTFRRGLAIELLEQEILLESFLREEWLYGLTAHGRREMDYCKSFARRCREQDQT